MWGAIGLGVVALVLPIACNARQGWEVPPPPPVPTQALYDLVRDIDQLRREVRALRGEVEDLTLRMEQQTQRGQAKFGDLDARLQKLETQPLQDGVAGTVGTDINDALGDVSNAGTDADRQAYDQAIGDLKNRRYTQAIGGFQALRQTAPDSPYAERALYWLAEAQYVTRDLIAAQTSLERYRTDYPNGEKAADAWLRLGDIQADLGRSEEARKTYGEVIQRFAGTAAAGQAQEKLAAVPAASGKPLKPRF